MDYETIIIGMCGILCVLLVSLTDLYLGNKFDGGFSDKTLERLTVKKNSILRKILPVKEYKNSRSLFLYIRVIPVIIYFLIFIAMTLILVLDFTLVDLIDDMAFSIISISIIGLHVLYNLILAILVRVFKL